MYEKLLVVVCIHIINFLVVEGRFETPDQLEAAPDNLAYAFIVFRHGIRSPINNIYGSDDEFLKWWPDGPGMLTEDGKNLMIHVGESLRTRYSHLVADYSADHVEFTSTLVPRATSSTYAVAAGMFPAPEVIFDDIPEWQPIPVWHKAGYDKHRLFDQDQTKSICSRYTKIKDSIINEEIDKLTRNKKRSLREINEKLPDSNSPIKEIKTLEDFCNVWDVYFMEDVSEKNSQEWTKTYMNRMNDLGHFRLWSRMHGKNDGSSSILQYYSGPILDNIINEMIQHTSKCVEAKLDKPPVAKCHPYLHLHGSHDLTVGTLMWALADNQEKFMAYPGDALILEAYQDSSAKLFLYSPLAPKKKFKTFTIQGCPKDEGLLCQFTQFTEDLKKRGLVLTEEQWRKKCSDMNGAEQATWRKLP